MVRQGLQDWALFRLAEQKGHAAEARAAIAKVYSQLGGCTYSGCPTPAGGFFYPEAQKAKLFLNGAEIANDDPRLPKITASVPRMSRWPRR